MLRDFWNACVSVARAVLQEIGRSLDRAGNDSDPTLWRLRSGAESAFDVSRHDETAREREPWHIPSF
jgi:hypothetical protein